VLHKEIFVPGSAGSAALAWASDRSLLWNAAEAAESRKNSRVAREYLVALPFELDPQRRLGLARTFSQDLVDRYGFALDLTVHGPREFPGSDPRNYHAHLLATTREVTAQGLSSKTTLEWQDSRRRELGLPPAVNELLFVRERWADVANQALRDAHVSARIDHRSLAAQGIDREPLPHIPRVAYEVERRGYRSPVAERLRSEYELRVQARLQRTVGREAVRSRHDAPGSEEHPPGNPRSLEEIRRQAREDWLRMRRDSSRQLGAESAVHGELARDSDLQR
jgi:ATP-dependent exoDNAse (exonuclease V) alpha subunit